MFSRGDFEDCITASKASERLNANGSMEHSPPLWLLVLRPCRLAKRLQTPPKILVRSLSLHLERRQERHGIQIAIPCWRRTRRSWLNRQRWIDIPKSAIRTKAQQSIWRHPGWELSRRVDQEQLYIQYLRKKISWKDDSLYWPVMICSGTTGSIGSKFLLNSSEHWRMIPWDDCSRLTHWTCLQ